MANVRPILIFGATGKQGGAVINNLIAQDANLELLAVTRDANSASAKKLAAKSPKIKLVQGDASHADALFEAAKGVASQPIWGVFSVQVPNGEEEEKQGKAIVDAALTAGVKMFVFSSVDRHGEASLQNPTDIPHFITKHNIEKHLIEKAKGTDMQWTILRPVCFMENLTPNFFGKVFATTFKIALKGKPLQLIGVSDIGFFGALAFQQPEQYQGKAIALAGDDITYEQMRETFKAQTGSYPPLTFEFLCSIMMYFVAELGNMFRWFEREGYAADIAELRKIHPELKDFKTWLKTESNWKQ